MADENSPERRAFRERVEQALQSGVPLPDFPDTSPLAGLAAAQNEAVGEFEKAGFERGEALFLTAAMFAGNPGQGPAH